MAPLHLANARDDRNDDAPAFIGLLLFLWLSAAAVALTAGLTLSSSPADREHVDHVVSTLLPSDPALLTGVGP